MHFSDRQIKNFWNQVKKEKDGCWLWTGDTAGKGYGRLTIQRKYMGAHRMSFILANGYIPEKAWVLHKCDVPRCVNPAHLFLGDHAANMADMKAKGRSLKGRHPMALNPDLARRGVEIHSAKLTEEIVAEMRKQYSFGGSYNSIAQKYGVTAMTAFHAINGITWRVVNEAVPPRQPKRAASTPGHPARFTTTQIQSMREMHSKGYNYPQIGKAFGASSTYVGKLIRGVCGKKTVSENLEDY